MNRLTGFRNLQKLNSISFNRYEISTISREIQVGLNTDHHIYTQLLRICLAECKLIQSRHVFDKTPQRKAQASKNSKTLHAQCLKFGFGSKGKLGNALVDLYAKCGDLEFARKTFNRLDEIDGSSWNSILSLDSRYGSPEDVIQSFRSMRNTNTAANQHTIAIVLSSCARILAVGTGKQVHCNVIKIGFEFNSFCQGSLIDMYAKCDCVIDARRIFDRSLDPDTVSWTAMIAGYVRIRSPEEALKLFKEMQSLGHVPDQVTFITVMTACIGIGRLGDACGLFALMPNPDVVAWNVMLSGHSQRGYVVEAVNFFLDMRNTGVKPTRSTLGSVLSAIASLVDLEGGQQVHCEAIRLGLGSNVYVGSSLINMYAKCQKMEEARKVFDALDERNIVLWNAVVGGYTRNGKAKEVVEIFSDMTKKGFRPDEFTYTGFLSACACLESVDLGRQLHSFIIKNNFQSNLFVGNSLVDMYAKSGSLEDARKQFELISNRDNVSWNAIIVGYVHKEDEIGAFSMFQRMSFDGIAPDEVSLASILSACANLHSLEQGRQVHCLSLKCGLELSLYTGSSLIDMYAKCGSLNAANKVFSSMPDQSVVSRNALLAGYVQNNNPEEAKTVFQRMQKEGLNPTKFTFASILDICSEPSKLNMGRQVHCYVLKSGMFYDDVFLGVSLLGMYLKCQSKIDATNLFSEFPNPKSTILWTAFISGHTQNGYSEEALILFRELRRYDTILDQAIFVSVLRASAVLAALREGREVHSLIIRTGFESDEFTSSALVDLYAKCGDIRSSTQVFEEMEDKQDVISWNSMIVGYAKNGYVHDALKIFNQMERACVKPDNVTFLGVLTACSHAGMVSEGHELFDSMINCYGIQPRIDHYACMIDLLGRRGCLKEAEELIDELPIKPDAMLWATLLAACRIHRDNVRGQRAAEKLIELEPQNSSPYVLISNIYAASGNWGEVTAVRKEMREKGVMKVPGCSWIVVGDRTSLFVAGDEFHPSAFEIYAVLKNLTAVMREDGYVAINDSLFHDED